MRYFVGVGAQKAGTTWLHHQLARHPQIALPHPRKELRYFDTVSESKLGVSPRTFFLNRLDRDLERLQRLAAPAADAGGGTPDARLERIARQTEEMRHTLDLLRLGTGGPEDYREFLHRTATDQTLVAGEISPEYSMLTDEGWAVVEQTLRPLVMMSLRDPLERYWSAVRMFARNQPDYSADDLNSLFGSMIFWDGTRARTDYETTLDALDRFFGRDRVLVVFFEEMMTPDGLRGVADFLGVDREWSWDLEGRFRAGRDSQMPDVPRPVRQKLRPVYRAMRRRFGDRLPDSWHTDL